MIKVSQVVSDKTGEYLKTVIGDFTISVFLTGAKFICFDDWDDQNNRDNRYNGDDQDDLQL